MQHPNHNTLTVTALTRDEHNKNWGKMITFLDPDGKEHSLIIPQEVINAGNNSGIYKHLTRNGLVMQSDQERRAIARTIKDANPKERVLTVSRTGWHKHNTCYTLPNKTFPEQEKVYCKQPFLTEQGYGTKGSLEEWQNAIAKPCEGNTRLLFALAAAFAPVIMPFTQEESGGFNLVGPSSIGKSTALKVAASVWGSPSYVQSWKSTSNALEAIATVHNHTLLPLDELGQLEAKAVTAIAYMLANGKGKGRMHAGTSLTSQNQWQMLFLSSGEIGLSDKIKESGARVFAGVKNRIVDIEADTGSPYRLLDTIHHYDSSYRFIEDLQEACHQYYGTPIQVFINEAVKRKEQMPSLMRTIIRDFVAEYVPADADGQVKRVAHRFALVGVAGECAARWGILPYPKGFVGVAVAQMLEEWLKARGHHQADESQALIEQVRAYIETHNLSRFVDVDHAALSRPEVHAGYKRKTSTGAYEFYVFPQQFRHHLTKGYNTTQACEILEKAGLLVKQNDRFQVSQRLPIGQKRIYKLTEGVLAD